MRQGWVCSAELTRDVASLPVWRGGVTRQGIGVGDGELRKRRRRGDSVAAEMSITHPKSSLTLLRGVGWEAVGLELPGMAEGDSNDDETPLASPSAAKTLPALQQQPT